jgi:CheY-like chemotaxis protein
VDPRILIVDDNLTNLRLATDILKDAGCEVMQAIDAEAAQAVLDQANPDLILMDIALPGMDGLSLTRILKADARFRDIPIVALTASAMKGDDARALAVGCQGYITKPIDTRRFAQEILAFLTSSPVAGGAVSAATAREIKIILVVDDYAANRTLLRAGLEPEGYVILEAANGVQALDILARERVDAVISDILMPCMDGFRLCGEIRKSDQEFAALPFILYTSTYDSPGDRELAVTVGADDYVLKPAPIPVMLEALGKARLKGPRVKPSTTERPTDAYVLEQYSAALVRKLEERNFELQQTLTMLQSAHEEIVELNCHLEARVEQRTAALEAVNEALEAFSSSVAHDLRAPLRHICSFAERLRETAGEQLNASCQDFIGRITGAAKRMDQLISDLLAFSRSGRTALAAAPVELETVLKEALERVQGEMSGRNIEWRRTRLPMAYGDRALLRQVLINLLSNAIKYSRARNPAVIEIGHCAGRAHEVVVYVRDNGAGFDMGHARLLFGVFQRLHTDAEFEGTGIGLASAHQIIARHGGRMWAEAAVNQGATFYFSLPAIDAPAARVLSLRN